MRKKLAACSDPSQVVVRLCWLEMKQKRMLGDEDAVDVARDDSEERVED